MYAISFLNLHFNLISAFEEKEGEETFLLLALRLFGIINVYNTL